MNDADAAGYSGVIHLQGSAGYTAAEGYSGVIATDTPVGFTGSAVNYTAAVSSVRPPEVVLRSSNVRSSAGPAETKSSSPYNEALAGPSAPPVGSTAPLAYGAPWGDKQVLIDKTEFEESSGPASAALERADAATAQRAHAQTHVARETVDLNNLMATRPSSSPATDALRLLDQLRARFENPLQQLFRDGPRASKLVRSDSLPPGSVIGNGGLPQYRSVAYIPPLLRPYIARLQSEALGRIDRFLAPTSSTDVGGTILRGFLHSLSSQAVALAGEGVREGIGEGEPFELMATAFIASVKGRMEQGSDPLSAVVQTVSPIVGAASDAVEAANQLEKTIRLSKTDPVAAKRSAWQVGEQSARAAVLTLMAGAGRSKAHAGKVVREPAVRQLDPSPMKAPPASPSFPEASGGSMLSVLDGDIFPSEPKSVTSASNGIPSPEPVGDAPHPRFEGVTIPNRDVVAQLAEQRPAQVDAARQRMKNRLQQLPDADRSVPRKTIGPRKEYYNELERSAAIREQVTHPNDAVITQATIDGVRLNDGTFKPTKDILSSLPDPTDAKGRIADMIRLPSRQEPVIELDNKTFRDVTQRAYTDTPISDTQILSPSAEQFRATRAVWDYAAREGGVVEIHGTNVLGEKQQFSLDPSKHSLNQVPVDYTTPSGQ